MLIITMNGGREIVKIPEFIDAEENKEDYKEMNNNNSNVPQ